MRGAPDRGGGWEPVIGLVIAFVAAVLMWGAIILLIWWLIP